MSAAVFTLGEREFRITPPPRNMTSQWRKAALPHINALLDGIAGAEQMDLQNLSAVINVGRQILPLLLDAPDTIFELLVLYHPELTAAKEHIDTTATDEEVFTAFAQVVRQAFPLDALKSIRTSPSTETPTNSRVPRGASARPNMTRSTHSSGPS